MLYGLRVSLLILSLMTAAQSQASSFATALQEEIRKQCLAAALKIPSSSPHERTFFLEQCFDRETADLPTKETTKPTPKDLLKTPTSSSKS